MMQILIRIMLVWAVVTGATYLVSAVVSEIKQWATRRALRHVTPKEIAQMIRQNQGKITADELHMQTAMPRWVAKLVLSELAEQKLLEEKYEKNSLGKRTKQFALSIIPSEQNLRFQINQPNDPNRAKKQILSDADVIHWAVASKGRITPARLCLNAKVTIEEATKRLDQLHMKGVFDLETNSEGNLYYKLTDDSLLET